MPPLVGAEARPLPSTDNPFADPAAAGDDDGEDENDG